MAAINQATMSLLPSAPKKSDAYMGGLALFLLPVVLRGIWRQMTPCHEFGKQGDRAYRPYKAPPASQSDEYDLGSYLAPPFSEDPRLGDLGCQ